MKRSSFAVLVPLILLLPACAGDEGSGGTTGPQNADVSGSWDYNATDLVGAVASLSVSCDIVDAVLVLNQQGTSFSGTREGGLLTCELEGGQDGQVLDAVVPIANGRVAGNEVQFDFEVRLGLDRLAALLEEAGFPVSFPVAAILQHEGTSSGSTMFGVATLSADLGPEAGVLILVGSWSASRR